MLSIAWIIYCKGSILALWSYPRLHTSWMKKKGWGWQKEALPVRTIAHFYRYWLQSSKARAIFKVRVLFKGGWAILPIGAWLVNYSSVLHLVNGTVPRVLVNVHTNDSLNPFPISLCPQLPMKIEQQPSGNMDDSGFFSIQVSSLECVRSAASF